MFAFSFGLGKGFLYPVALEAGWTHLPKRKGFVSGFITSGMGLGPFAIGIIANKIVNPNNESNVSVNVNGVDEWYFPMSVNKNVPELMRFLTYLFASITIIGVLTVTNYPKKTRHTRTQH